MRCRIAVAALIAATTASAGHAETVTLRYGQIPSTQRSVQALHLAVAQKNGLFAREGLAVEFQPIAGGTDKMIAALERGDVELAHTATPYLIQPVLKGSDAVAIAAETANPIYSLVAKPDIADIRDLKGKLVGLSLAVDTISISMRRLLAQHGLNAEDYRVKELVGTPARSECLKRGECDAVPLGQPEDFLAMAQGYRRLGLSTDAVAEFEFTVLAVRRGWAPAHKDSVVRFVRALADAFRYIRAPENRDAVAQRSWTRPERRSRLLGRSWRSISSPTAACCRVRLSSTSRALPGDRLHGRSGRGQSAVARARALRRPSVPGGGRS